MARLYPDIDNAVIDFETLLDEFVHIKRRHVLYSCRCRILGNLQFHETPPCKVFLNKGGAGSLLPNLTVVVTLGTDLNSNQDYVTQSKTFFAFVLWTSNPGSEDSNFILILVKLLIVGILVCTACSCLIAYLFVQRYKAKALRSLFYPKGWVGGI